MASFSMEDFVGNGALKELLPKLIEEGWDDVPTLKLMNSEDMAAVSMTQQQKDALEIRSYLHDRAMLQYADRLEASGRSLPELLNLSTVDLSSQFGMKRGHMARFVDRTNPCADPLPKSHVVLAQGGSHADVPSRTNSSHQSRSSADFRKMSLTRLSMKSGISDRSLEKSLPDLKIKDGHIFKGIIAAAPAGPRVCGCVNAPPVTDQIAPYSAIEKISVQKITPEHKIATERLVKTRTPPMKASELWRNKPAVFLCIRRPGCIMCRAEAYQLYSKKPIFDALGVQLFAVVHQHVESEVKDFWPRYWGGVVLYDHGMEFFKALGGGQLLKDKFISGFLLNPVARANYKRAKAIGAKNNFKGQYDIKGGLFIVGSGKSGIAYQFIEQNFGDWAPLAEVVEICSQLQNHYQNQGELSQGGHE